MAAWKVSIGDEVFMVEERSALNAAIVVLTQQRLNFLDTYYTVEPCSGDVVILPTRRGERRKSSD